MGYCSASGYKIVTSYDVHGFLATATVAEGTVGRHRGVDPGSRDAAALAVSRKFAASARDAWIVAGRILRPVRDVDHRVLGDEPQLP